MRQLLALALAAAGLAATPALASAAPPVNDAYLASLPVDNVDFTATTDTTEATTQADLFNPSATGAPLGGGDPEPLTCDGTAIGKTVWYDLAPQSDGDVLIRATGFATVVAVYEWSARTSRIMRQVDCSANTSVQDLAVSVRAKRRYTIQVGGAGGAGGPLNLKVDYLPDSDRDGRYDPLDECPDVAGIGQFGGCPPVLNVRPRLSFANTGSGINITRFVVERVPKGAKVVARCGGCGAQTVRARRTGTVTLSRLVGRAARAGATIQVKVTMRRTGKGRYRFGATGKSQSWRVRVGGITAAPERCLNVRTGKSERCP
jgi:hypothetical protein